MKKTAYSLLFTFICASLFSCSNDIEMIEPSLELQSTQAMATKTPTKELIKNYVDKCFSFADKNKDKKLILSEFKTLASEPLEVMQERFILVDANKDKSVNYEEFSKVYSPSITSSMKEIFLMLDSDRNKFLDIENGEVQVAVEMDFDTLHYKEGSKITLEEVKNDYISRDSNKDGKLTFEDYQNVALKYMLMTSVDPYKNSIKNSSNPIFIDDILKNATKKFKK